MDEKEREGYEAVYRAIVTDDPVLFGRYIKSANTRALRYGRFPLLSLCYLYRSKNIVKAYERELAAVSDYVAMEEDYRMYSDFRKRCGRELRFYALGRNPITPLEMLAVLGEDEYLRSRYNLLYKDEAIKERLTAVYRMRWGQQLTFTDKGIKLTRRKIAVGKRAFVTISCAFSVLLLVAAVLLMTILPQSYGGGTEQNPFLITTAAQLEYAASHEGYYLLQKDLTLDEPLDGFVGNLDGNGKTVTLKGVFAEKVTGKLFDINFKLGGDIGFSENYGAVITVNEGELASVGVVLSAAVADKSEGDTCFACFVYENKGTITDCTVDAVVTLSGNGKGDVFLCGLTGINTGTVKNCVITDTSRLTTDSADVSGIAKENGEKGVIDGCVSGAAITQTSTQIGWNPNVAGIALTNNGTLNNCVNNGALSATLNRLETSVGAAVIVAGITATHNGTMTACVNNGTIKGDNQASLSETPDEKAGLQCLAGGLTVTSKGKITDSENRGNVEGKCLRLAYSAGAATLNYGLITDSENHGSIASDGSIESIAGGLTAINHYDAETDMGGNLIKSANKGAVTSVGNGVSLSGGVTGVNYYYVGECVSNASVTATAGDTAYAGGVAAYNYYITVGWQYMLATVELSSAQGAVKATATAAENATALIGGVVGYNNGAVQKSASYCSYATDNSAGYYIGGICGWLIYGRSSSSANCYLKQTNAAFGIGSVLSSDLFGGTSFSEAMDGGTSGYQSAEEVTAAFEAAKGATA